MKIHKVIRTEEYLGRLKKIPLNFHNAIEKAVERLISNPFLKDSRLKDSLLLKHEVSKYRILYYVNGNVLEIWTIEIIPRKEDYKNLKEIEKKFFTKYPSSKRKIY